MNPEDRQLLQGLLQQQSELRQALDRLDARIHEMAARVEATPEEPVLPPIPDLPPLPPAPPPQAELILPPIPKNEAAAVPPPFIPLLPPIPTAAAIPAKKRPLGWWLFPIGSLCGVIGLALILSWSHSFIYRMLGPAGILGLSFAFSFAVIFGVELLERRQPKFSYLCRTLTAMALAWLYLTSYTACFSDHFQIIRSPLVAGCLLLIWSLYVLTIAERKNSQVLSLFAITLAYFSTALNPMVRFTMAADLALAMTAVFLLVRNGWSALSYFSLAGTYLALLRRLVIDEDGELILDPGRTLHFWPYATYLFGTWLIFTCAVCLARSPGFRGGNRFCFLSLNNGAWVGLLLLTAYVSGYGHGPIGWILLVTGLALLIASRFVGWTQVEPEKAMAAYAAQGLAVFTAGIIVFFTGISRGVVLLMETFFLGCAGNFAADRVLLITTYVAGFFATVFLIWEVAVNAHHPWLLGFGGAAVMLLNAWMARNEMRHSPQCRTTFVEGSSYYSLLAIGLIFTSLYSNLSDPALPPSLALAALVLTFSVYVFALYELPPLAQILLLAAQALVIFPIDTGESFPWWTTFWVAVVTLVMTTWWSRQRVMLTGSGTTLLTYIYSLAMADLTYQTVRPWVHFEGWVVLSSVLSVAFLVWGALTRTWPMAAVGQLFLAISVYHFLLPPEDHPLAWVVAAMPLVVVFSTARAAHRWLDLAPSIPAITKTYLRSLAYGYQLLVVFMLIRWVVSVAPLADAVAALLFMGTLVFSWNVQRAGYFGLRCSYVLTVAGLLLYLENLGSSAVELSTFLTGLAFFSVLLQPVLLRPRQLLSIVESWTLVLFSMAAGMLFVSTWVITRDGFGYLTAAWALYALVLFLLGFVGSEKRLQWCGLGVIITAIVRAGIYDFWGLSIGYRILTFIVLTIICFSIGYLSLRTDNSNRPS